MDTKTHRVEDEDLDEPHQYAVGYKHAVTVQMRFEAHIFEFEDVLFHHDSAVMMPDGLPGTPEQDRITGLGVIRALYFHARVNTEQKLLIAGHTDTSGPDKYNEDLSLLRAENVLHVIEGNKDPWVEIARKKNKVEDYQHILMWIAAWQGWACDPEKVNGKHDKKTDAAVREFQTQYSKAEFGESIKVDGDVGKQTWGAFFVMYMERLKEITDTDDKGLEELRGKIQWLYDDLKFVGCGEYHPIDQPYLNNRKSQTNRRVEAIFYDPGEEPTKKPGKICHTGGKAKAAECRVYNRNFYDYNHIDPKAWEAVIQELKIVSNASGSTASKSLKGAGDPDAKIERKDLFCFAPEVDAVSIGWVIKNEEDLSEMFFELFTAEDRKNPIWSEKVSGDDAVTMAQKKESSPSGSHTGCRDFKEVKLTDKNKFPDKVITVEHAPYELRLKVTSGSNKTTSVARTQFDVVVADLTLELGEKDVLSEERDKKLYDAFKGTKTLDKVLPGPGAKKKAFLISNIYKTSNAEMNDNSGFTQYKNAWGEGPNIPIFAKVLVKDINGKKVSAPKALGAVKFLWDWEDVPESTAGQGAKPKAFLDLALNYHKAGTQPQGDNCHKDRGGKRGSGANPVFPPQAGYAPADTLQAGKFPFKVEACSKRKWAAFSTAWTDKKLAGKTGVMFQPARMSGDAYKLTVYLADEKKDGKIAIDVPSDPPLKASVKKECGNLEIWREIHIVRYILKDSSIVQFIPANLAGARGYFQDAFIQAENKMDADNQYELKDHRKKSGSAPNYNALCRAAVNGSGNGLLSNHIAVSNTANHFGVPSTFLIRSYNSFKTQLATFMGSNAAANTWMTTNGYDTQAKYARKIERSLFGVVDSVIAGLEILKGAKNGINKEAADGVTIIHFNKLHNLRCSFLGKALTIPGESTRNKCGFLFWQTRLDTFVHEIGHQLFMPHAHGAPGAKDNRHDAADTNCLMSYNRPRPDFCGLCLLRLRGWDATALKKNGAQNKKP